MKRLSLGLAVALVLVSAARAGDNDGDEGATDEGVAYFEKHIRPLLAERCYACHSSREKKQKGGLLLDSRAGMMSGGDQGPAVIPGDLDASLLIRAVRYTDPDLRMPPDRPLSSEAVVRLEHWVKIGAPDPRDGVINESERPPNQSDPIAGREHWAFRPLREHRPPVTDASNWPQSPIDSFILEKLEAAHLQPAPDADDRTLLRRAYFQLIGLPPTPEQVAGKLFGQKPVEGNVGIDRGDDPIAIPPRFAEQKILVEPVGIRVSRQVQPMPAPPLAEMR